VRNAVSIMRLKGSEDSQLQWCHDVIERQADQLKRLVDDLLDVSRITQGKIQLRLEPVDVETVVAGAVETSAPVINAQSHELRVTLPETPLLVHGDASRLTQVIANLLNNAAKYQNEQGTIDLTVRREGHEVVISVRDHGIGLSREMLSEAFELFTQGERTPDRAQGGLGIGLSLVKKLVELHGGSVRADSAGEQQGSTFTVDLPTAMSPEVRENHVARTDAVIEAPSLTDLRVLVVEDEADSRDLLVGTLTRAGAVAIAVSSCDEALAVLRQMAAAKNLPHVILSDLGMPREDGFALIRKVRTLPADEGGAIPAVAVTGYANPDDRQRALAAGFHTHLAKPIDPVAVANAVMRAISS